MASAAGGGGGNCEQVEPVMTSVQIKIWDATVGKHYMLVQENNKPVNRYLGKYTMLRSKPRDESGQYAPIPVYIFENETIDDDHRVQMVVEVNDSAEVQGEKKKELPMAAGGGGGGGGGNLFGYGTKNTETNVGPATMAMLFKSGSAAGPAIMSHIAANGGGQNLSPVQETAKKILNSGTGTEMETLLAAALMTQSICGCRGFGQYCSYCH